MPQRTNAFQKLVKTINTHLAQSGVKVIESAMFHDKEAGIKREVDILVESTVHGCNIRIGIECNERKRPLDVVVIDGIHAKHRKIGINQTIIVSKHGFTQGAKTQAAHHNIKLLTFNSAQKEDWLEQFKSLQGLSLYARQYYPKSINFSMSPAQAASGFEFGPQITVLLDEKEVPLLDYARDLFLSSGISTTRAKELMANEQSGGADPFVLVGFDLEEKINFKDTSGRIAKPKGIEVVLSYSSNYRSLETKQVGYQGKDMVVGGFFDEKSHANVAFSEIDGKLTGTLEAGGELFPPMQRKT
jgi:hypothetical protein